jgi:hypothetical protein
VGGLGARGVGGSAPASSPSRVAACRNGGDEGVVDLAGARGGNGKSGAGWTRPRPVGRLGWWVGGGFQALCLWGARGTRTPPAALPGRAGAAYIPAAQQ